MLPGQEILNVPRRTLDVEDYIDILRRHKGWIIGPTLACLVAGVVGAFLWPDTYRSSAVIRVIPSQVPDRYVPTNINQDISNRVNSIYQSITSRATLTNIINLYQLYPRDRKRLPMEDVIEQMRKDIRVNFVNSQRGGGAGLQAFEISYSYENRHLAQKIVTDLVTRFIDENIRSRASQSVMTTDFLKDQWEQRKRDLDAVEKKITQFRIANQGRLPEERGNLQGAVHSIEGRIGNLNAQISRSNQDKMLLESRLNILKDQLKLASVPETSQRAEAAKSARLATLEREIQNAETRLEAMRENYRDTHPDIKRMISNISVLKRTRDSIREQEEVQADAAAKAAEKQQNVQTARHASRETRALEAEIQTLQTMIEARGMEIDNYTKEMQGAERNLRVYQGKLESMPTGIAEYEELLRERALAQTKYEEMNLKMAQSQSATDLENRKQGETLELLDPASLPMTPAQPNRPMIIAAATGMGFLLGLVIAGAREMKDTTLKNLKDVRAYTHLMVLGSVPILENDLVIRRRRRMAWLAWTTASLAGIVIVAGSIVFYYANKA